MDDCALYSLPRGAHAWLRFDWWRFRRRLGQEPRAGQIFHKHARPVCTVLALCALCKLVAHFSLASALLIVVLKIRKTFNMYVPAAGVMKLSPS